MAELKIKADSGGGTVSLKGPATTNSNAAVSVTLPKASIDLSSAGTDGQFLKTDGAGTLSFATVSQQTNASNLASGTLPAARIADDSIVEAKLDISNAPSDDSILQYKNSSDKLTWVPRGHQILQIQEWSGKSWSTHTGDTGWHGNVMNESESKITPTATTSKMAVWGNMHLEVDSNNASTTIVGVAVRVLRMVSGQDDVEVYRYNQFLNRPETSGDDTIWTANASFHFVDDPGTTSEIEYRTQTSSHHSSATVNIGSANHFKGITILELAE